MSRGQGRWCRQRGVIIQCSEIPRLKMLVLIFKFLSLYNHVSFCYYLKNCSPITFQQSAKTSDVKSLRLDNIYQLVLPWPVSDTTDVIAFQFCPSRNVCEAWVGRWTGDGGGRREGQRGRREGKEEQCELLLAISAPIRDKLLQISVVPKFTICSCKQSLNYNERSLLPFGSCSCQYQISVGAKFTIYGCKCSLNCSERSLPLSESYGCSYLPLQSSCW